MRLTILVVLWMFSFRPFGQTGLNREFVLSKIESLQVVSDDFYASGLFPVTRTWMGSEVDDNTVFLPAAISYTLQKIHQHNPDERYLEIIEKINANFENYRSRRGRPAYNFWATKPQDLPFPNSSIMSKERFRLPDDFDDTSVIQLAKGPNEIDDEVRDYMLEYYNRTERMEPVGFLDSYLGYQPYEVWFADQMDQQLDIVVMANVLLFVLEKDFDWRIEDEATKALIIEIVSSNAHMTQPESVSAFYATRANILYNLARIFVVDELVLEDVRVNLIQNIITELQADISEIEKLMLYSSLKKLNYEIVPELDSDRLQKDVEGFVFFSGDFRPFGRGMVPKMYWHCEAFCWTLVLEFLVLYEDQVQWSN
jgi:hypothetical protein